MYKDILSNDAKGSIRKYFDEVTKKWYFSIVDVIGIVTQTSDSRNYWKVLKNRLKKAQNKLVTDCNQLKMRASDGKFYLTDVADSHTLLDIIKIISPTHLESFDRYFDQINSLSQNADASDQKLSTLASFESDEVAELPIDLINNETVIIIKSFVPCIAPESLSVTVGYDTVTIEGERPSQNIKNNSNYFLQEIYWGKFCRLIKLPALIEIDRVDCSISHGLLIITLQKINLSRTKKIKILNAMY